MDTMDSANNNTGEIFLDLVQPFLIDKSSVKGKLVRLGESLDIILHRHDYPEVVSKLLGEMLVVISMLGASLKIDGLLTAQMKSDGPVRFLVADCTSEAEIRGYAEYDEDKLKALAAIKKPSEYTFKDIVGEGYLAITLDQGADMERYQGIVGLEGDSLIETLKSYYENSEQIDVALKVYVGQAYNDSGKLSWVGGGIMVQKLPEEGGIKGPGKIRLDALNEDVADDNWNRAVAFVGTVRDYELLDPTLPPRDLLFKLFHEDGVWAFDSKPYKIGCRCSRERIQNILLTMPVDDIEHIKVDGAIKVTCQFCNKEEIFTDRDLKPQD